MTVVTRETRAQAEIRDLLDTWVQATRAVDIDTVMRCYADTVRAFDVIGQLQFQGIDAYGAHWRACMSQMHGAMIFEPSQIEIEAEGDLGFAHFLARCGCEDSNGEMQDGWVRGTVCLRRIGKAWRIVHEHYSNPVDPETMMAVTGLEPEPGSTPP